MWCCGWQGKLRLQQRCQWGCWCVPAVLPTGCFSVTLVCVPCGGRAVKVGGIPGTARRKRLVTIYRRCARASRHQSAVDPSKTPQSHTKAAARGCGQLCQVSCDVLTCQVSCDVLSEKNTYTRIVVCPSARGLAYPRTRHRGRLVHLACEKETEASAHSPGASDCGAAGSARGHVGRLSIIGASRQQPSSPFPSSPPAATKRICLQAWVPAPNVAPFATYVEAHTRY